MSNQVRIWTKGPNELLDYLFDFAAKTNGNGRSDYLENSEAIVTYVITTSSGIIAESESVIDNNTAVQFWIRGGDLGETYRVTVEIVTSNSRIVERSIDLRIVER